MEGVLDSLVEFIRIRQLNVAVVVMLSIVYLVYQYWGCLSKERIDDLEDSAHSVRRRSRSRSRSKTRSHHDYKDSKHGRGSRRCYGKCPDCRKCNSEG